MQPDTKEENMFFPDGNTLILNEQQQKQCEGFLTASECLESLKSMESNKSPGSDGLPAGFEPGSAIAPIPHCNWNCPLKKRPRGQFVPFKI